MLVCLHWQRDRAAWLMGPNDSLVDNVAENLLDRLEVLNLCATQIISLSSVANLLRLFCVQIINQIMLLDTEMHGHSFLTRNTSFIERN